MKRGVSDEKPDYPAIENKDEVKVVEFQGATVNGNHVSVNMPAKSIVVLSLN